MFIRSFFLLLLICLPAAAAPEPPLLLVVGDSLSAAYGLPHGSGWVDLLEQRLRQHRPAYRVVNASISGETSQGGAYRIDSLLKKYRPAVVIISLGANDGLRGLPVSEMRANLSAMVERCRAQQAKVLLVGMRLPPNYGTAYSKEFHAAYGEVARRYRIQQLAFLLQGIAGDPAWFQPDGLHPTAAAQPLLLENVWRILQRML
ncbi:MAG: arylesterase [Sulfuricellaceae bacterium]|nr:arylesterase [Sulfuricellaceae bacterium]